MALTRCALVAALASFVVAAPLAAQAGTGIVTGRIIDSASQQPLVSATIRVVGTTSGTLTRNDGTYTLSGLRPGAQTLRVTRIGFAAQTRPVTVAAGASVTADFILVSQAAVLSDVVITGYGSQRRESITGSVSTVNADQANVGVVANASQLLSGRVAGVRVTSNNGEPGGGVQITRPRRHVDLGEQQSALRGGRRPAPEREDRGRRGDQRRQRRPAAQRAELDQPERHRVDHRPQGRVGDGDLRQPRRERRRADPDEEGRRGASSVEYDTYVAGSKAARHLDFLTGDEYRTFVQKEVAAGNLPASQNALNGTANTDWERALLRDGLRVEPQPRLLRRIAADELSRVAQLLRSAGRRHLQRSQALSGSDQRPHVGHERAHPDRRQPHRARA